MEFYSSDNDSKSNFISSENQPLVSSINFYKDYHPFWGGKNILLSLYMYILQQNSTLQPPPLSAVIEWPSLCYN